MEHNKEKMIEEILGMPVSYAKFRDLADEGQWNKKKLENMATTDLIIYLRDLQIFERNRKRYEQTGN